MRQYVWGEGIDECLKATVPDAANLVAGDEIDLYYHHNSIGSVVAVTKADGTVVESYRYSAFGKPTIYNGSNVEIAATAVKQPFMFTGARYDFEEGSGLYQMRHRYYDPVVGRFVSRDPLGLWGDPSQNGNGQGYCGHNPVNLRDPFGLDDGPPVQGVGRGSNNNTTRESPPPGPEAPSKPGPPPIPTRAAPTEPHARMPTQGLGAGNTAEEANALLDGLRQMLGEEGWRVTLHEAAGKGYYFFNVDDRDACPETVALLKKLLGQNINIFVRGKSLAEHGGGKYDRGQVDINLDEPSRWTGTDPETGEETHTSSAERVLVHELAHGWDDETRRDPSTGDLLTPEQMAREAAVRKRVEEEKPDEAIPVAVENIFYPDAKRTSYGGVRRRE